MFEEMYDSKLQNFVSTDAFSPYQASNYPFMFLFRENDFF